MLSELYIGFRLAYCRFIIEHMNDIWGVADELAEARAELASVLRVLNPDPGCDGQFDDVARIDAIRGLEDLKNVACAAQVVLAVGFARSQRAEQARRGVPAERVGRGVAEQVALARRESPHAGAIFLGMATILVAEMPRTLQAMSRGVLSEYRARIVVQETSCLTREVRADIDEWVCGDPARLDTLGSKRLGNLVRGEAARWDPGGVAARLGYAVEQRFVSLRPAPDCMTRLTALLPVAQGVSVLAALTRAGDTARAGGDPRSRGQVMADELVVRVTGQTSPDAVPVGLHLVIPAGLLFDDGEPGRYAHRDPGRAGVDGESEQGAGPARIVGYGPIPEALARHLVAAAPRLGSWFRRLYAVPAGGLVAMESRRRLFPQGLAEFITIRDDLCRTPFCDAPIRHIDHIVPAADGGHTTATNGQGLCERCNHAKQAPGWTAQHPTPDADGNPTDESVDPPDAEADAYPTTAQERAAAREGVGQVTRATSGAAQGRRPTGRHQTHPAHEVIITTPTGHHYTSRPPGAL